MPSFEDDITEDLIYIKYRLQKFIRKASYWEKLTDLNEEEIRNIQLYNSRIRDFIVELKYDLFNVGNLREDVSGSSRTFIYSFGPKIDSLISDHEDIKGKIREVNTLLQTTEAYQLKLDGLKRRLKSNRGKVSKEDNHRSNAFRRKNNQSRVKVKFDRSSPKKVIWLDDSLLAAIKKDAEDRDMNVSEWIRQASFLELHASERRKALTF